jgi:gamma-glutamylcyclotransferase (GGCT)/AIG2-like uncharacterized protein YtfP
MEKVLKAESEVNLHKMPEVIFFVFGTLKRGFGNHYGRLDGKTVEYLGEHVTEPKFTMYSMGGFPGMLAGGSTAIHGELFRTKDREVIKRVCSLEGCTGIKGHTGNWYDIESIETPHGTAYMFLFRNKESKGLPIINSGVWKH